MAPYDDGLRYDDDEPTWDLPWWGWLLLGYFAGGAMAYLIFVP